MQQANILPSLRCVDAELAIEWLCRAFGFVKHLVVADGRGAIAHAQPMKTIAVV